MRRGLCAGAIVAGGVLVWATVAGVGPPARDAAWAIPGIACCVGGLTAWPRQVGWLPAILGLSAAALMVWAALSQAPVGAMPAPEALAPSGMPPGRAWFLGISLLLWWLSLVASDRNGDRQRTLAPYIVGLFAAARAWSLVATHDLDFFVEDEGWLLYGGLRLLNGEHLYRDFFEFLYPGSFLATAFAFSLGGRSFWTVHIALTLLLTTCTLLVYGCIRRVGGQAASTMGALLFLLALAPHTVWWSAHWMAVTSGLAAVWLLSRDGPPVARNIAFGAGLLAGLTLLFQQHRGAAVAVALALACVIPGPRRAASGSSRRWSEYVQGVGLFAVGAATLPAVAVLLLLIWGDFAAFWAATWQFLWAGYRPATPVQAEMFPINTALPAIELARAFWAAGSETVVRSAPLALLIGGAVALCPSRDPERRARWRTVVLGSAGVMGAALLRYEYLRLVYAAPATCVLLAGAGCFLGPRSGAFWKRAIAAVPLGALIVSMATHAWREQFRFVDSRPKLVLEESALGPVTFVVYTHRAREDLVRLVRFLHSLPPDAEVFFYPAGGGMYALTGRDNPTRFSVLVPGYNLPEHVREVVAAVEDEGVEYVVWDHFYTPAWLQVVYPGLPEDSLTRNPFGEYVRARYEVLLSTPTITIYVRPDAKSGDAHLDAVRQWGQTEL